MNMVPEPSALPLVLPTNDFAVSGRPLGPLRTRLYSIPNARNAFHICSLWAQTIALLAIAVRWRHPVIWAVIFLLQGRTFVRLSILTHEAAHRLLFSNRKWNDSIGKWVLGYPALLPIDAYRRGHMAHHKEEFGPNEPDMQLYAGYPISRASWHRKLLRDAVGISGVKNLKLLWLVSRAQPRIGVGMVLTQLVLAVAAWLVGAPLLWPLLWFAPWMTVWRVFNRLRAVAEHGGMQASPDRRMTTHVISQHLFARFWIVPYNTGWHLAHHTDIGVPWIHLPEYHTELTKAGWITPALAHQNYRQFWKAATTS